MGRHLRPRGPTVGTVDLLVVVLGGVRLALLLLLLHAPLPVPVHEHLHSPQLLHALILCGYVVVD